MENEMDEDETMVVEVARAVMSRNAEGNWDFEAQAQDWLSLFGEEEIAPILHAAAAAVKMLADSFGPDEAEAGRVLSLVPKPDDPA